MENTAPHGSMSFSVDDILNHTSRYPIEVVCQALLVTDNLDDIPFPNNFLLERLEKADLPLLLKDRVKRVIQEKLRRVESLRSFFPNPIRP